MTRRCWMLLAGPAIAVFVGAAILTHAYSSCPMTEGDAKGIVVAELSRVGLDPEFLRGPTHSPDECSFYFDYEGDGHAIGFVVADDLLHGPELHQWDYANDPNGP